MILGWGYISWSYYSCDIKGFCGEQAYISVEKNFDSWSMLATSVVDDINSEELYEDEEEIGTEQENISSTGSSAPEEDILWEEEITSKTAWEQEAQEAKIALCSDPLIGPISYGANNDSEEVQKLEEFLASQGNAVEADGIYGASEFAAVKAFQEEYRGTILDPWGINNPTGYVFTTTIKKIEEVACN